MPVRRPRPKEDNLQKYLLLWKDYIHCQKGLHLHPPYNGCFHQNSIFIEPVWLRVLEEAQRMSSSYSKLEGQAGWQVGSAKC
jgi:hypothetical protein